MSFSVKVQEDNNTGLWYGYVIEDELETRTRPMPNEQEAEEELVFLLAGKAAFELGMDVDPEEIRRSIREKVLEAGRGGFERPIPKSKYFVSGSIATRN